MKPKTWLFWFIVALVVFFAGCYAPPPRLTAVLLGFLSGAIIVYITLESIKPI